MTFFAAITDEENMIKSVKKGDELKNIIIIMLTERKKREVLI